MKYRIKSCRSKEPKPTKLCDPGVCDCCQYIGEGDYLCDKYMEVVISDWEPTSSYLLCEEGEDGQR